MSLSFLYPLAWIGVLAVGVPIWLHLERRRQANVVRFSALQFLEDQPTAQREPLWPRDWPLLLLRLSALLLLVAAFSWPYWSNAATPQVISQSTVFVFDNTLSHQAGGRFDEARAELVRQLEGIGEGHQVAVIELTAVPHVASGFGESAENAINAAQSLRPSYERGSYRAAMQLAVELLEDSLGEKQRIVLIGDHQKNQWDELHNATLVLNNIEVQTSKPSDASAANIAISRPMVRRDTMGGESQVEGIFSLHHERSEDAEVELRVNGDVITRQTIALADQPREMALLFRWPADEGQWLRGDVTVRSEDDVLPGDNRVFFSLPPVEEGTVALLATSRYLRTALEPDVMQGRWKAETLDGDDLTATSIDSDVLVVETSKLALPGSQNLVTRQLNSGRGVLMVVDALPPQARAALRLFDITAGDLTASEQGQQLRYIFYEHPLLEPFRSSDFGDLLEILVYRYHPLKMTDALPLVYSAQGDPLLLQGGAQGRLFVLALPVTTEASNWPIHPTFVPLLDRCLAAARPEKIQQAQLHPGEATVWAIPDGQPGDKARIRMADGSTTSLLVEGRQIRIPVPHEPGLYELEYGTSDEVQAILEVNPSPEESQLQYTDPEELVASWTADPSPATQHRSSKPETTLSVASILRQRLWWWLLLLGVLALIAETTWLAWRQEPTRGASSAY